MSSQDLQVSSPLRRKNGRKSGQEPSEERRFQPPDAGLQTLLVTFRIINVSQIMILVLQLPSEVREKLAGPISREHELGAQGDAAWES